MVGVVSVGIGLRGSPEDHGVAGASVAIQWVLWTGPPKDEYYDFLEEV
jgi:hypothetical protein